MSILWKAIDSFADATVVLSYSSIGYKLRAPRWTEDLDALDLRGRVVVVTGANSGIGLAASRRLASIGARVVMVCRDPVRGEEARRLAAARARHDPPILEIADLSSLSAVRGLASRVAGRFDRLDVLANNAGVLPPHRTESVDGIEMTFATNVLAGFHLVHELLPLLKKASAGRIVHVTSGGMYTQKIDVDDPLFESKAFDGVVAYAQTKRAQVILSEMWADRLKADGITSNCMHPGWADTPGVRDSLPRFYGLLRPILRTPDQGADTLVWLAAGNEAANQTGQLLFDRTPRRTHLMSRTEESPSDRDRLWALCARLCGIPS